MPKIDKTSTYQVHSIVIYNLSVTGAKSLTVYYNYHLKFTSYFYRYESLDDQKTHIAKTSLEYQIQITGYVHVKLKTLCAIKISLISACLMSKLLFVHLYIHFTELPTLLLLAEEIRFQGQFETFFRLYDFTPQSSVFFCPPHKIFCLIQFLVFRSNFIKSLAEFC